MRITRLTHPYLFDMLQTIDQDHGRITRLQPAFQAYDLDKSREVVDFAENLASNLSAREREDLAIGEETEVQAMLEKDRLLKYVVVDILNMEEA